MRPFEYVAATSPEQAVERVSGDPEAMFLAGGSNVVDHLKLGIIEPTTLVDVSRLGLDRVDSSATGLRIGAGVSNSALAAHPVVRSDYPVLSRALLAGASAQLRHQATTAGNLLQRSRCVYFQDTSMPCNKREPGTGCSALEGYDRYNAVLGTSHADQSQACVSVHPSDLAVALSALDASVEVLGPDGSREVALDDFYRLPGEHPEHDTTLAHGELITAVLLPALSAGSGSSYYKARDRASYAFALVSVAAILRLDGDLVEEVRLSWGGVAHRPWRARIAEEALTGARLDETAVRRACAAELADARTTAGNGFKPAMVTGATAMVLDRLSRSAGNRTPGEEV